MLARASDPTASPWRAHLICMSAMVVWSTGLPANTYLMPIVHPIPLAGLRFMIAALVLLPFWLWQDGWQSLRQANWLRGLGAGAVVGSGGCLVILGQAWTDPVTVAVISATLPVVGLATEMLLDGRKMTQALLLGLVFAVAGGVLALGTQATGINFGLGALLCAISTVFYTLGSRWTITGLPGMSNLGRCAVTMVGGGLAACLIWGVAQPLGLTAPPDFGAMAGKEWGALMVFVVGSLVFSQILWIMAVDRLGVGMAALHINATPFYVMLIALALGGLWNWWQAAGAALVAAGVVVAQGQWPRKT
jgi:drug/metabolite transporter (DMT)-like permease